MNMLKGFGQFIMRGNVVDLAVAVVIGAAFSAIVNALVKDLITPLITAVIGKPDFSALSFEINNSVFHYGEFINAVISFIIVAAVIYFAVVTPMNAILERVRPKNVDTAPVLAACPECLSDVPAQAKRCRSCTAVISPTAL